MSWFKVDDKLHEHTKSRKAGVEAMGLWTLAGSYAADNLTDGFVPEHTLTRWCMTLSKGRKLAAALVTAALWHPDTVDGEKGWRFHSWSEFQPTKAEVEGKRQSARERMQRVRANKDDGSREQDANVRVTPSRPDPTRPVVVQSSSHLTLVPGGMTDDDLTRIAEATGGNEEHAARVARDVLDRTNVDVRNPVAYVLRAVEDDPKRYRMVRRLTPDTECTLHAGQFADNCGGCAADRKAAR